MPAGFDKCRKAGGRVRTISGPDKKMGLIEGQYLHVCVDKGGGFHRGEVKSKLSQAVTDLHKALNKKG